MLYLLWLGIILEILSVAWKTWKLVKMPVDVIWWEWMAKNAKINIIQCIATHQSCASKLCFNKYEPQRCAITTDTKIQRSRHLKIPPQSNSTVVFYFDLLIHLTSNILSLFSTIYYWVVLETVLIHCKNTRHGPIRQYNDFLNLKWNFPKSQCLVPIFGTAFVSLHNTPY